MHEMTARLICEMANYEQDSVHRVDHLLKVYAYCMTIAALERVPERMAWILETAAVVHDIGIRPSLARHNSSAGVYQQQEGVAPARAMLEKLGYPRDVVERVCFLVAHHHTYAGIDGIDYQILVEADCLVNIREEKIPAERVVQLRRRVFRTQAGSRLLDQLYLN